MAKKTPQPAADADDLFDDAPATKPGKKTAAAAPAAKKAKVAEPEPAPAKKASKKAAEPEPEEAAAPAARVREPLEWEDGEKDEVAKAVKKFAKKPINSRDLAEKCGTTTRKLRTVLYSMQAKGVVTLESGASRVQGMTVTLA